MKWLDSLSIGDLPEDLRFVAETCGLEVVKTLLKNCSGTSVYIPKNAPQELIERTIRREYTGETFIGKRLANRLGISEIQFFKIAKRVISSRER